MRVQCMQPRIRLKRLVAILFAGVTTSEFRKIRGVCHPMVMFSVLFIAAKLCSNTRFGRVSQFPIAKQGNFLQACAAESHSCALDNEGGIACWGLNSLDRAKVPDKLKNVKWKELSCGGGHTCAIDVNGWPACWGFGKHGQVNSKQLQKHF